METVEIKRGDYVEIIPREEHTDYIKSHYGKAQRVTGVATAESGNKYYKLAGIKGHGPGKDIKKIEQIKQL